MMKVILMLVCALLPVFSIIGISQNSITGTITIKENGKPLPGAVIYMPDLKQGTLSDQNGKYQINNLPSGSFLVEIKNMGYGSIIRRVNIAGNTSLDISMEESAVEMNEVIVTGSVTSTQKLLNPIPTVSISHHELTRNSSINIIDGLTRVPGISQISTGNAISKPIIRGLGYNRVLVLHDDIRQEGQQWGDEHGVEIDENSVDKVEIIKGPGSLIYGSDALGGVINFISTPTLPDGKIEGNFLANFQTNNKLMNYSASNQGNINGVNWLLRGTYKQAGNFRNNLDNLVYNSGYSEKNLNGYLGLTKNWGYSFLRYSTFNQELGIIEGERDSAGRFLSFILQPDNSVTGIPVNTQKLNSYDVDIPKQIIHHNRIQLNSKFLVNEGNIQTDIGIQKNVRKEFADPAEPKTTELYFLLKTLNYDIKYNFPAYLNWRNIIGISGMSQSNSNKGEEQLIPDYTLNDIGLYFTSQKTWEKFHLSAGIRYNNRFIDSEPLLKDNIQSPAQPGDYKFKAINKRFSNLSFGVGISKNISATTIIKFNYSKGFRAPNLAELATNGKHEGTFRYEYGNIRLKTETSNQVDAGIAYNTHHVSFEINSFINNVQHFVYLKKLVNRMGTDSIPDPSDPSPAFNFTHGNALLYGGEVSLDIHPHPFDYLHLQQSFSLVKGFLNKQSDSTRNLPFIPSPQYRAEVRLQPIKLKKLQSPYILLEYQYNFNKKDIFSAYGTETPTTGYGLLNFGVGTGITLKQNNTLVSVHFQILNLMNIAYQNHLSRLKYAPVNPFNKQNGIYNPGRSFSIKLEIPLKFKS